MKFSAKTVRKLPILLGGAALLISGLQALAYLTAYEAPTANYFARGSVLPSAAALLASLTCLFGIFAAARTPRGLLFCRRAASGIVYLPATFGFFAGAGILLFSCTHKFCLPTVLLLILSGIFCLLKILPRTADHPLVALLGFASVLGCILLDAIYYFDPSLEMNAPLKESVLVGILFVMIYLTAELRVMLNKAMPRVYMMFVFWLFGAGTLAALPVPFAFLIGRFSRDTTLPRASFFARSFYHPEYLSGALVILGVLLTAGARFWQMARSAKGGQR